MTATEDEAARLSRLLPHADAIAAELFRLESSSPTLWGAGSDAASAARTIRARLAVLSTLGEASRAPQ